MSVNFNISRRTKILACVAAALAIVCAAQFLLGLRSPQKNFKLKGEPDYISIENSGATLVLQKSESGWISGTEALDSNKVNLLIKSLSPLATLGVTSRSASEAALERYGLDKPIKVCLKAKDKNLLSLSHDMHIDYIHMEDVSNVEYLLDSIKSGSVMKLANSDNVSYEDTYYYYVPLLLIFLAIEMILVIRRGRI